MDDVYDLLIEQGFTPDQIDQLMEAGVLVGEQERVIPQEQRYAEELRGARYPRGRSYEGVYQRANPMEHAAYGLERMAGMYGEHKSRQRQKEILEQLKKRRSTFLRGGGRTAPMASGAPVPTKVPWNQAPVLSVGGTPSWR